jgi:hypothetical protein
VTVGVAFAAGIFVALVFVVLLAMTYDAGRIAGRNEHK